MELEKIIDILSRFKFRYRKIWAEFDISFEESYAEHSMHVALLCLHFMEGRTLQRTQLLRMAILHEIPAIFYPEFSSFYKSSTREDFLANEELIQEKILKIFSNPHDIMDLLEDYYDRGSEESKFIFQIKVLETILQAQRLKKKKNVMQVDELHNKLISLLDDPILLEFLSLSEI